MSVNGMMIRVMEICRELMEIGYCTSYAEKK